MPNKMKVARNLGWLAAIASLAPSPEAFDDGGTLKAIAEAKANVARKIADFYADPRLSAIAGKADGQGVPMADPVEYWTRKVVDARLDAAANRDERLAILLEDVERTKALEARIRMIAENTPGLTKLDAFKAEYFRLDADNRLAREKAGK